MREAGETEPPVPASCVALNGVGGALPTASRSRKHLDEKRETHDYPTAAGRPWPVQSAAGAVGGTGSHAAAGGRHRLPGQSARPSPTRGLLWPRRPRESAPREGRAAVISAPGGHAGTGELRGENAVSTEGGLHGRAPT